jgi:hypothetical protein
LRAEAASPPVIEAKADQVLRQMAEYLSTLKSFSWHTQSAIDEVLSNGFKLQFAETVDVFVRRPNRLRVNGNGDKRNQQLFYDGKSVTLFDEDFNTYATVKAPPDIEKTLDYTLEAFNISAPLSELVYRNAYDILTESVQSGFYIGLSSINGVKSHHLAFRQKDIDWQIWIEDSKTPLPRKLVITSKWVTGAPQFISLLSDWNTSAQLTDSLFNFVVPEKAEKIEFLPAEGK